jgi:hypothetical protein
MFITLKNMSKIPFCYVTVPSVISLIAYYFQPPPKARYRFTIA